MPRYSEQNKMPTKKRKYEARFPPARIKKIMQTDEEIGKVAAAVPVIISRALEIFLQQLVEKSAEYTRAKRAKTMTTGHLKQCIESENQFDFLKDLVSTIADMTNQEEEDNRDSGETKPKKPRKSKAVGERKKSGAGKRSTKSTSSNESDDEANASDDDEETTKIFPRGDSTASEGNHIDDHQDSGSEQGSHTSERQKSIIRHDGQSNSLRAQPIPIMFQSQNDDDEEDYDEDD